MLRARGSRFRRSVLRMSATVFAGAHPAREAGAENSRGRHNQVQTSCRGDEAHSPIAVDVEFASSGCSRFDEILSWRGVGMRRALGAVLLVPEIALNHEFADRFGPLCGQSVSFTRSND